MTLSRMDEEESPLKLSDFAVSEAVEETADKPLSECSEAELLALWDAAKSHDPS